MEANPMFQGRLAREDRRAAGTQKHPQSFGIRITSAADKGERDFRRLKLDEGSAHLHIGWCNRNSPW